MTETTMTFGSEITEARKRLRYSQKELAALVKKEDGQQISQQYLNDLEHDRRNPPPPFLIEQFAEALKIEPELLYYLAGEIPAAWVNIKPDRKSIVKGYRALYRELTKSMAA
jgi:transcriptional regulator with XRE-family HTH domain